MRFDGLDDDYATISMRFDFYRRKKFALHSFRFRPGAKIWKFQEKISSNSLKVTFEFRQNQFIAVLFVRFADVPFFIAVCHVIVRI